ncbi:MAG: branched-chain amino acid ABC transporter permease [Acidimicrobiales bacterium]|nr:branched-chain amino acid ABC transporter permease [Acidimicrobiales bacterium]MCB1017338.1 branched-chain amino acid ABC transporter permease [Acidimicrobiales bacterium]
MEQFLERMVLGMERGSIYALLALAIVLIFRSTGLLNFAQGEMAMFSTFVAWTFQDNGAGVWVSILAAMLLSFLGGAVIERVIIRPVEGGSPLNIVIVTVGMFLALNALAQWIWGTDAKVFADAFPDDAWDVAGVSITADFLGRLATLAVVAFVLYLLFQKTKLGLAMRAVASNTESSGLVGIRVGRMLMIGWGLAAALGALAGCLTAARIGQFDTNFMIQVLVFGFAAATLGGLDSPLGAVVGGLIVGVVQELVGQYIGWVGEDLRDGAAFVIILVILLVKPSGLFGKQQVARV